MNIILKELLTNLRKSVVLLAADTWGLREILLQGYDIPRTPVNTSDRIVLAAEALGMAEGNPLKWVEPYYSLAFQTSEWNRTISVIEHQQTYLRLARSVAKGGKEYLFPSKQLASSPEEYLSFLKGVDASHWSHAEWLSNLPEFKGAVHLVDLGGGLGTFSRAWIHSRSDRRATLVDLPDVEALLSMYGGSNERIEFLGADLLQYPIIPNGDLYLLANVLHLLPGWNEVVRKVVEQASKHSLVAIMEANPSGPEGRLFDLQVHLRSGGNTGLLQPVDINLILISLGLLNVHCLENFDDNDPFQRKYHLWIGQK